MIIPVPELGVWSYQHNQLGLRFGSRCDMERANRLINTTERISLAYSDFAFSVPLDADDFTLLGTRFGHLSLGPSETLPVGVFNWPDTEIEIAVPLPSIEQHFGLGEASDREWSFALGKVASALGEVAVLINAEVAVTGAIIGPEHVLPEGYSITPSLRDPLGLG